MTAWHVYGILEQQPRDLKLEGLHGAPVHALGGPNVWALASEVTTGLNVIPTNALDPIMHHKVIEAALEHWVPAEGAIAVLDRQPVALHCRLGLAH